MLRKRKGKQRRLPGFEKVDVVEPVSKCPQPRITSYKIPKRFELVYRPLDLNFRGQLNHWFANVQNEVDYKELMTEQEERIIDLYLFPQGADKRWLNQKEVMKKVTGNPNSNLKKTLVQAMLKMWTKDKK